MHRTVNRGGFCVSSIVGVSCCECAILFSELISGAEPNLEFAQEAQEKRLKLCETGVWNLLAAQGSTRSARLRALNVVSWCCFSW